MQQFRMIVIFFGLLLLVVACDFIGPPPDSETPVPAPAKPVSNVAPVPTTAVVPAPTMAPTAQPATTPRSATGPAVDRGGVKTVGVPDPATNIELAAGNFKNTLGLGTRAFLAEPGGLLVGPDFGSGSQNNPWGANPGMWDAMYKSNGHTRPFSPDTQHSFANEPNASYLASVGGWAIFSVPNLTFEVLNMRVEVPAEVGLNNLVFIRGLYYAGPSQDQTRNAMVRLLDFVPGATLGMRHPGGYSRENTAFWSEGQFKQFVATSHLGESNCGSGCSKVRATYLDLNTRALGVWEHQVSSRPASIAGAVESAGAGWTLKYKNYVDPS